MQSIFLFFSAILASMPMTLFGQHYSGHLEILAFNQNLGDDSVIYYLKDAHKRWRLLEGALEAKAMDRFKSGDRVAIEGSVFNEDSLIVDQITRLNEPQGQTFPDIRRALFMVVDFTDKKASMNYSKDQLQQVIYGNQDSVNTFFNQVSLGKTSFAQDADNDGEVDITAPLNLNIPASCDVYTVATAAEEQATIAGYDLSIFQHRVFVLPPMQDCGWGGVANVGCTSGCRAWLAAPNIVYNYTHELGHNLGLGHAGFHGEEYGDFSDPMGSPWKVISYNAPHLDQLGWLDIPGQSVTEAGEYTIKSLGNSNNDPTMLLVTNPNIPGKEQSIYYISYRNKLALDSSIDSSYTALSVHKFSATKTGRSDLMALLGPGETFSDSINRIYIKALGLNPSQHTARVQVNFNPLPDACADAENFTVNNLNTNIRIGANVGIKLLMQNKNKAPCSNSYTMTLKLPAKVLPRYRSGRTLTVLGGTTGYFQVDLAKDKKLAKGCYPLQAFINNTLVLDSYLNVQAGCHFK